jgi:hypothetical protein
MTVVTIRISALRRATCFFGLLLLLGAGCGAPRATADQVRQAITEAGVLKQPPSVVQDHLRGLVLPEGERLWVGEFEPDRRVIPAQVRDPHMRSRDDWNVQVTVHFDTVPRAVEIEAFASAANPL